MEVVAVVAVGGGLIESSLHVTNTIYSGLQEHRIIVYTATGQKAMPKISSRQPWLARR
jgi:hypothetical protein